MKPILLFVLLTLTATTAGAQEWKEALKRVATEAADKLTDGQLTRYALAGSWSYTGPGIRFESDDLAGTLGAAALESTLSTRLAKIYATLGIAPGACTFVFGREGDFSASAASRTLTGSYDFDAATHVATLHFSKGNYDLGSIAGHAYLSGDKLQLVFPVTKLIDALTAIGSSVSSLAAVSSLLRKYDDVYLGFAFERE